MSRTLRVVAVLFFTAVRTSAHHAFAAEYDANKLVTVSGIVAKFEWINPHALLYFDRKDAEGKAASWMFEMGSPGGLERRGRKRTDLKNGDEITGRLRATPEPLLPSSLPGIPDFSYSSVSDLLDGSFDARFHNPAHYQLDEFVYYCLVRKPTLFRGEEVLSHGVLHDGSDRERDRHGRVAFAKGTFFLPKRNVLHQKLSRRQGEALTEEVR